MEVVVSEQVWEEIDNDKLVFDHIRVIVRQGSRYFFARQQDRYAPIDATQLDLEEIPDTFLYAQVPAGWTRAPDLLPADSYIKQPNLLEYGETSNCCTVLLQEAEIYEGYSTTLKQRVERHAKTKDEREPALSETEKRRLVQGIRDGIAHIHLLGLVHNDLNPSNVMVENGTAIIIDFDSCRRQGEPMGMKGPTPGWGTYIEYANLENDVGNLDQIERYLLG
ncbi:hypothetical protein MFIFM68171_02178 [Madurella fahalii]|uniref:Protein kinase domain-containing protein n=1 Tax=Madurella fahalii TaxID=1157608 RepID=A0ABQ0G2H9_9PEZI